MKTKLVLVFFLLTATCLNAQQLQILDRFNGNALLNDSTITIFSSDVGVPDLTRYFTMKNNTDQTLAVFLKKRVNFYADSTSDYYCFGIRCWPGDDSTNIADSIPPGGEDYTFASHVTHVRRFDLPQPALPVGLSSITYTIYDKTTFPEPVEATLTVLYHLSGVGLEEARRPGGGEAGKKVPVYPNPAHDWINIDVSAITPGSYMLQIMSSTGTLMESREIILNSHNFQISTNNYPGGMYFGRITSVPGDSNTFHFQIMH